MREVPVGAGIEMAAHLRHQHAGGSLSTVGDTLHEFPQPLALRGLRRKSFGG
jgi:hypothetical protein